MMKKNHSRYAAILALLFGTLAAASALAQTTSISADDRYTGYPRVLVEWPISAPDLKACEAQEYYEPSDTHLTRYSDRVKVAKVRVQEHDECTWMLTRNKWRWVMRPQGTKVAQDAQGRDLFDFGSPSGQKCANPRPVGVPVIPPPPAPVPQPPPAVPPPPAPAPPTPVVSPEVGECQSVRVKERTSESLTFEAVIKGSVLGAEQKWYRDEWEEAGQGGSITLKVEPKLSVAFRFTDQAGNRSVCRAEYEIEEPPVVVTALPPKRKRKFPIPCFPRERGWYGTGLPIAECAAIGVLAWWLWPVAEAIGTKITVPVISP